MPDSFITPLLSVALGAAVSYYVTLKTKEKDYKNDFYKKVIEKRIAAYERLEKVLHLMQFSSQFEGKKYYTCMDSNETYEIFKVVLSEAIHSQMWLSSHASTQLAYLNGQLITMQKGVNLQDNLALRKAASQHFDTLTSMRGHLHNHLKIDYAIMYDVEAFFKLRR